MKKLILITAALLVSFAAQAQKSMVVNSELIFKSVEAYNSAVSEIDKLGEEYQKKIDEAYADLETTYNNYQSQKAYMSESSRSTKETAILAREKEIMDYQESIFGQDGELLKKRVEKLKPIQDKVFGAINSYAEKNGYTMVFDIASNPMVLYYSQAVNKTDDIIALLK